MNTHQFQNSVTSYDWIEEFEQHIDEFLKQHNNNTSYEEGHKFLLNFNKEELAKAKKHWNNFICVEFWKFYKNEVEKLQKELGKPLYFFEVTLKNNETTYTIEPINYKMLDNKKLRKKLLNNNPTPFNKKISHFFEKYSNNDKRKFYLLEEKLLSLLNLQVESILKIVKIFEKRFSQYHSIIRVVNFLDTTLYHHENKIFTSPFKQIFFSNNSEELLVFLSHLYNKNLKINSINSVRDFLNRQNQFSLQRALKTSMEATQVYNHHKDLYEYDEEEKIVKIKHLPKELLQSYKKQQENFDIPQASGCPFAKSKGVEKNTLVEHYEYFNQLFLNFLENSQEFKDLFLE